MNIELFCCAGGMAEGFRRAGIEFDLAFDQDPNACDSYEANLGKRPIQMDCHDLLRLLDAGWRPENVDLVVADPPCTPWSRAGKHKGLEDERDLLRETVAFIGSLKPTVWLIGNVPGLDDSNNWGTVQGVIGGLADIGYCVDYQKLDAANYGVPQKRIRPFWFGHRAGTRCIQWPKPTHGDPAALGSPGLGEDRKPWVTCKEALAHLSVENMGRPVRQNKNPKHPFAQPKDPAFTISTGGSRHQGNCLAWPWDRPATTIYAEPRMGPPGHHEKSFLSPKDLDRPATAVTCRDEISQPSRDGRKRIPQSANAIVLSERAAAILQGFPETWVFSGKTKKARWSQIGQAMPPPLAHAVASSIVQGGYLKETV